MADSSVRREIEEVWPSLSFYYHLSFSELIQMPRWARRIYAEALGGLLAETELMFARASAYPHMKKGAASKYVSELRKLIKRRQRTGERPSVQELAEMGIRVIEKGGG